MSLVKAPKTVQVPSVGELTRNIKSLLEGEFRSVWVSGEVSNLTTPRSGHLYFTLKDADAQMRAVIWRSVAFRLPFDLKDGMEVIVLGRVTVWEPRGEYQIQIEGIQPKGIGPLELAFRQLREKLFTKGYFDRKRKKPISPLPKRIALVTSPSGAAVRDMLEIISRRWPAVEIWVCPVQVQGEGAAEDIAAMIRRLNQCYLPIDVLIVGRGGGSLEDLWAFNEETVAQAIFDSRIPIISAVGHEVDLTIADLVADKRANTPSEAAEVVVPEREEILDQLAATETRLKELLVFRLKIAREKWEQLCQHKVFRLPFEHIHEKARRLDDLEFRLTRGIKSRTERAEKQIEAIASESRLQELLLFRLKSAWERWNRLSEHKVFRNPLEQIKEKSKRLEDLYGRLQRAVKHWLDRADKQVELMASQLKSLSPLNVLARGYSLTKNSSGKVLRDPQEVRPGELLETLLEQGKVKSRAVGPKRKSRKPPPPTDMPELF